MLRTVALRLVAIVPLLGISTLFAFALLQLSDVDAAEIRLGPNATEEQYDVVREELGVDRSPAVQYVDWAGHAVRGDFGTSWVNNADIGDQLKARLPVTLSLTAGALLIALVIGIPAGILAAVRNGRPADQAVTAVASFGQALPNFWVAILLAAYVGVKTDLFPATGYVGPTESVVDWIQSITLPSIALGTAAASGFARQTRSAVLETLDQRFVRTAVSNGFRGTTVLTRHVLRNSAIPLATVIAAQATLLLGGSVIVEQVFALPGMGSFVLTAIRQGDHPVVLGFVAAMAVTVALVQLVLDLSYAWIDPRVRVS